MCGFLLLLFFKLLLLLVSVDDAVLGDMVHHCQSIALLTLGLLFGYLLGGFRRFNLLLSNTFFAELFKFLVSDIHVGLAKDVAVVIFVVLALFIHFFPILDEVGINGAADVEANSAVLVIALDTDSGIPLFTDGAKELAAGLKHSIL